MAIRELNTPLDVIEALGGVRPVADMRGRTYKAAWNWTTFDKLPADTFVVISKALAARGYAAPPSLWGMISEPAE